MIVSSFFFFVGNTFKLNTCFLILKLPLFFPAETSKVDYVLFQAATAIMEAVVREWILLEKASIESLRTFLLTYVLQRPK